MVCHTGLKIEKFLRRRFKKQHFEIVIKVHFQLDIYTHGFTSEILQATSIGMGCVLSKDRVTFLVQMGMGV